jgi:hypothetical protein
LGRTIDACGLAGRFVTSRRRKEEQAYEGPITAAARADRRDYFRRVLLGIVTALLVARPLVSGEDPGRLQTPEATSGIILNLCWLGTAVLSAIWLARSPRKLKIDWPIFLGLVLVAALFFLSSGVAKCYRHPAWLISFEFAILPILFLVIRQISADEDPTSDSAGGLLRAMLASFISLAGFGIYQAAAPALGLRTLDLPVDRTSYLPPGSDFLGPVAEPLSQPWEARSTLEHSSTLLAILLLGLPCLGVMAFRHRNWKVRSLLALVAALLVALLLAGSGWWREEGRNLVGGSITATRILKERPIFGAGPGNFDRHSPRLQPLVMREVLHQPGQAYLELAATVGVICAIVFIGLVALVNWNIARSAKTLPNWEPVPEFVLASPPRWEFYLGGALGLVLGLGLRVNDLMGTEVPRSILFASIGAVARALIWFVVFSWLDGIPGRGKYRQMALVCGLLLVGVFGVFSGAILKPVVLQLFWVFAALALAGTASVVPLSPQARLGRWALVPVAIAAVATYLGLVCDPAWRSAGLLCHSRQAARFYPDRLHEVATAPPYQQPILIRRTGEILRKSILGPLYDGLNADPNNERLALEAASWERALWELEPKEKSLEATLEKSSERALALTAGVHKYDPYGTEALVREYHFRLTVARFNPEFREKRSKKGEENLQNQRQARFQRLAELLSEILERDPALGARLRFRLIEALMDTRDAERIKEARAQIPVVKALDENAPGPRWRLSEEQRERIREWLKPPEEE